jgi:type III pantothenate kinase
MNLVLDFGNTRIKTGVFDGLNLVEKRAFDSENELLDNLGSFNSIQHCILGSVTKAHTKASQLLSERCHTVLFTAQTPIPIKNLYKSALTLGSDRVAASVGAWLQYPDRPVLTIDAGTCIKYNFVNTRNEYLGGAISPGIPMRLKAMHEYTSALPLVPFDKSFEKLTGESTAESLLSGALMGAVCEVDAMIDRYEAVHTGLQVVLTGGDADYLGGKLKNRFFANPDILLLGLNAILNYTLEH